MGILRTGLKALAVARPASTPIAASVPVGMNGVPQIPPHSYDRNAREGYMRNELVFACIEARATSAAEPRLVAYRGDTKITAHPIIDLWERPNPFADRYSIAAGMVMFRDIGGNAYLEKVRNRAGQVVELWSLRPDRVRVIPDERTYIGGYEYWYGGHRYTLPTSDVIQFRTRGPLAEHEYYGMPPLAPGAGRVDLDNWMRDFVRGFFLNAGVPGGLLNIMRSTSQEDRELIRARFRSEYGGPAGWHNLLVIDGGEAKYEAMGLPLGERGLVVPELDEINEARICQLFGVPHSIAQTRLGAQTGSYANRQQDETNFWELTLIPLYRELAAVLTRGLVVGEYDDIDRLEFDMADVKALAEDADDLHARIREDFKAALIGQKEARVLAGYPEQVPADDYFLVPSSAMPTKPADFDAPALPEPQPGEGEDSPDYQSNGKPPTQPRAAGADQDDQEEKP